MSEQRNTPELREPEQGWEWLVAECDRLAARVDELEAALARGRRFQAIFDSLVVRDENDGDLAIYTDADLHNANVEFRAALAGSPVGASVSDRETLPPAADLPHVYLRKGLSAGSFTARPSAMRAWAARAWWWRLLHPRKTP